MPSIDLFFILGALITLTVGPFLWWVGYRAHKFTPAESVGAIRLPRVLGLLFGSKRADGVLNVAGIMCQVGAYSLFVGILVRADILPQKAFYYAEIVTLASILLAGLVLALNYLMGKRNIS